MTIRINGIGTTLIGMRDFLQDGSFVTTQWFTFLYVPVIPLQSQRILPSHGNKYYILEKMPLHKMQVGFVYGWVFVLALLFAIAAGIVHILDWWQEYTGTIYYLLTFLIVADGCAILVWLFVPSILRRLAKRKLRNENLYVNEIKK